MATSKKIMMVRGLEEFAKLDTGPATIYKCVVEQSLLHVGRKPLISRTKDRNRPTSIVRATTNFVAVCQLLEGEEAPEYLPRVVFTYL